MTYVFILFVVYSLFAFALGFPSNHAVMMGMTQKFIPLTAQNQVGFASVYKQKTKSLQINKQGQEPGKLAVCPKRQIFIGSELGI